MGYQIAPHKGLGLPCGLYQFMSHIEGTALLFEFIHALPYTPRRVTISNWLQYTKLVTYVQLHCHANILTIITIYTTNLVAIHKVTYGHTTWLTLSQLIWHIINGHDMRIKLVTKLY